MRFALACFGFALALSTAILPTAGTAGDLDETVTARSNARAGGPTNPHDAWLLQRYGR